MGIARLARPGFSPLDEELALLPGELSPGLVQVVVELGATMPFGKAAAKVQRFTGVWVSQETVRGYTEEAGAAYVAEQAAELARLARELPPVPAGPAVQQVSVDGAMVPLRTGKWAEVKTLAIGTVVQRPAKEGAWQAHAQDVSYYARMTDAASFIQQAQLELHRRGTARAGQVAFVADGSEWIDGFQATLLPKAVRILDFPHAVEYLTTAGQASLGIGTVALHAWLAIQAHALKHEPIDIVLKAVRELPVTAARDPGAATAARDGSLAYLEKRREQLDYARFVALGYPIGSGMVESANKLVVEARLKGSGMHWAPVHVDPMLALRTIECADRWDEAWPGICRHLREQRLARRHAQHQARHPQPASPPPLSTPPAPRTRTPRVQIHRAPPQHPPTVVHGRPTASHPWKRALLAGGRRHQEHNRNL
jgi:hypothetical protein